jgi:hypothetical protein
MRRQAAPIAAVSTGLLILLAAITLAACTTVIDPSARPTPTPEMPFRSLTPEPPTFNVETAKAFFEVACSNGFFSDDDLCEQLNIEQLGGNGSMLIMRTTLDPTERGRAGQICGALLGVPNQGWDPVTIEDKNGDFLTGCIA